MLTKKEKIKNLLEVKEYIEQVLESTTVAKTKRSFGDQGGKAERFNYAISEISSQFIENIEYELENNYGLDLDGNQIINDEIKPVEVKALRGDEILKLIG